MGCSPVPRNQYQFWTPGLGRSLTFLNPSDWLLHLPLTSQSNSLYCIGKRFAFWSRLIQIPSRPAAYFHSYPAAIPIMSHNCMHKSIITQKVDGIETRARPLIMQIYVGGSSRRGLRTGEPFTDCGQSRNNSISSGN